MYKTPRPHTLAVCIYEILTRLKWQFLPLMLTYFHYWFVKKKILISHMWNFRLWELEPHSSGICACKTKIKKLYYFYCWLVRGYYIMIYSISSFYFLQVPPQMTESEYRRTDNTMFKSLNIPKRKSEATNRWSADNVMDKQFEDSKEVIRSRKSKNRQHNGQTFADTNWVIKIRKLKNRQI